jgi:hypothetical protein
MRFSIIILISILLIEACSEEEENLKLFSPEAFAYSLENGWELNASVYVKGFIQTENEDVYSAKLSYSANMVLPSGKMLEDVDYGIVDETSNEEMIDLSIEIQIELDSSFAIGQYKIIFKVTDDLSQREASIEKPFELSMD